MKGSGRQSDVQLMEITEQYISFHEIDTVFIALVSIKYFISFDPSLQDTRFGCGALLLLVSKNNVHLLNCGPIDYYSYCIQDVDVEIGINKRHKD